MSLNINNNPLIEAYNLIEYAIRTNVDDINPTRRNLPTAKEKQWIFPSTPEDLATYYPRIAIVLNSISYSELGSNQFIGYQIEPTTGEISDLKANFMTMNMTIGIFSKKKDKYSVTLPGKTSPKIIGGTLLNSFLFGEVQKTLLKEREYFLTNGAEEFNITNVSMTYNNTEVLFSSSINISIRIPNVWGRVYTTGELINEINKNYTITRT